MLNRIFLRKSKEILNEVQSAEGMMRLAEAKIDKLKSSDKFSLLKEELHEMIKLTNVITRDLAISSFYNQDNRELLDKTAKEINECVNEMEKLTKEKHHAISQGKESENT